MLTVTRVAAVQAVLLMLVSYGCGGGAAESVEAISRSTGDGQSDAAEAVPPPERLSDADQAALKNPCSLLPVEDVRRIAGRQEYREGRPGDALGEGVGGGASCQWRGPVFGGPAEPLPQISLVVIPPRDGERWTSRVRANPRPNCSYTAEARAGAGAFIENCARTELPIYVPTRALDIIVAIRLEAPATNASVQPVLLGLANEVATRLR
ncbi:MAG: hypothetical protein GEU82_06905 [Luteitalea sp.]|nr:hypothetical protein [Luteitalea sp.]